MMRDVISNEWFTGFMVLGLLCITMAKLRYTNRFLDFIGVLGNSKYLKLYTRDQKLIDGFDSLLFFNFVIALSIFGYHSHLILEPNHSFELDVFFKLILGITALLIIKTWTERLIGSLFEMEKMMDSYLFQKTSYKNFSGMILLAINAFLLYSLDTSKIVIIGVILVVLTIHLIGLLTSFKNHQKTVTTNIFYLILYLCALEIGPYLILYKIIVEYKV